MATKTKAATPTALIPVLQKQTAPVIEHAEALTIMNAEDMANATETLSSINTMLDKVVAYKEAKTKPLNVALKLIREETKPLEKTLETARDTIRSKMSMYQTAQKAIADKKAADIAKRVGEGKGKLKPETAVQKMSEIDTPDKKVSTQSGAVEFVTVKHFEVTDLQLLAATSPEYVMSNDVAIRQAMREGKPLQGVRYYETQEPRNTRN